MARNLYDIAQPLCEWTRDGSSLRRPHAGLLDRRRLGDGLRLCDTGDVVLGDDSDDGFDFAANDAYRC